MTHKHTCLLIVTALLLTCSAVAQSGRPADPAEFAPDDAVLYVGCTDVDRLWHGFQKTAAYELMNDPMAGDAQSGMGLGAITELIRERVGQVLDVPSDQIENPFGGSITLYVAAPPGAMNPEELQPGLIAGVGKPDMMKRYFEAAIDKLKDISRYSQEDAGDTTIHIFLEDPDKRQIDSDDDSDSEFDGFDGFEGGQGGPGMPIPGMAQQSPEEMLKKGLDEFFAADNLPKELAMCLSKDRLIVAGTEQQVRAILRRDKSGRTLADTDDHKALLRKLRRPGPLRVLVNIPRIVEIARMTAAANEKEDIAKAMRLMGAESLGSLVGHMDVGARSYDSRVELLLLMQGRRTGMAEILSMENQDTAPPQTIGADTCMYVGMNLNIADLFDKFLRLARQADPDAAQQIEASMEIPTQTGQTVNVRRDFIDHLRGPLSMTLGLSRPAAPGSVRMLLTLGHRDQKAMVRFIGGPMNPGVLVARDVRGTQVFDMMGPMGGPMGVSVAPVTDRLIVGNTPAVEASMQPSSANPLRETLAWKSAARFVPDESWFTLFVDNRQFTEGIIDLAQNPAQLMDPAAGPDFGPMAITFLAEMVKQTAKDGDLNNARELLKYAAPEIMTISTTEDGLLFSGVQLKPQE